MTANKLGVLWLGNPQATPVVLNLMKRALAGLTDTILVPDVKSGGGI